jgi:uncharacterized protein (TIGR02265 family)
MKTGPAGGFPAARTCARLRRAVSLIADLPRASDDLDLERRLREIPRSAKIRGVFFRLLEDDLRRRGVKGWPQWGRVLGEQPVSHRLYPVHDLLVAYAEAAALISNDPREGIRDIFQGICQPFSESWYGRAWKRYLKPDPFNALRWLERCREHVCNYGSCRLESRGPGRATLHMMDEYFWIDSAHRGGCEGLLKVCGVDGEVTAELESLFHGRLNVSWKVAG